MSSDTHRWMARAGLVVGLVGVIGLTGCTSVIYDSNPEGTAAHLEEPPDFASRTVQNLLAESIGWAVDSYPPPGGETGGWIAINLPRGMTREQYIAVAAQVGARAVPITPEVEGELPVYHIGWVWMRGDVARVDVFRPVFVLSRGDEVVHQAITLHMKRRWASWRVERTQPWEVGVVALPPVSYMPEEEVTLVAVGVGGGAEIESEFETDFETVDEVVDESEFEVEGDSEYDLEWERLFEEEPES